MSMNKNSARAIRVMEEGLERLGDDEARDIATKLLVEAWRHLPARGRLLVYREFQWETGDTGPDIEDFGYTVKRRSRR